MQAGRDDAADVVRRERLPVDRIDHPHREWQFAPEPLYLHPSAGGPR
jgi:hypothetical protein